MRALLTNMTFEDRLKSDAADTEADLKAALSSLGKEAPDKLVAAMRHGALAGGKRLRPFLVRESARLFDCDGVGARTVAAALECIHCYSLVHDDLPAMDDDDLRRGQPTVHKAYDEATAILAGDGLLTLAFEMIAREETHNNPLIRCRIVEHLARAAGAVGMVGGQMLDLNAEVEPQTTIEGVTAIQSKKTGALIRFGVMAGALLADAAERDAKALSLYGDRLGLAFQIKDDLLDVESSEITLGKAVSKDADAGKATFVSLYGLDGAKARLKSIITEAEGAIAHFGARASVLKDCARFVGERTN
ncbi:MAG: polyprenyl synthetase family protein [Pseudomonadota bacterium]